jgi:hypothetical protein
MQVFSDVMLIQENILDWWLEFCATTKWLKRGFYVIEAYLNLSLPVYFGNQVMVIQT